MDTPVKKKSSTVWVIVALLLITFCSAIGWQYFSITTKKEGGLLNPNAETHKEMEQYSLLNKGKQLLDEGRYADALKNFQIVIEQTTNTGFRWQAELATARAQVGLGAIDKALAIYERVRTQSGDKGLEGDARIYTAEAVAADGKIDEAIVLFNETIDYLSSIGLTKHCSRALRVMASVYEAHGQYGLLRATIQRIIDEFPGSEDTDAFLAQQYLDQVEQGLIARQDEAISQLEKSTKLTRVASIPAGQTISWTADGGPYLIEEVLTVPADSVVKIAAGAQLRFGLTGGLRVNGRVEAVGTSEKPIRCLSIQDDVDTGWWKGLHFESTDESAASVLTHVHIIGAEEAISASSGSVTVTECDLKQSVRAGLLSKDAGTITAKNCRITQGKYEGIRCENGGKIIVEGGRIAEQKRTGVTVSLTRTSTLTGTVIENNQGDGVVFLTSSGTLKDCTIRGNGGSGVICRADSTPALEACDIANNQGRGITCTDRSKPVITRSRIHGNQGGGVGFETRSDGRIVDSVIEGNAPYGVWCKLANPQIEGSRITGNRGVGVLIEAGRPQLAKNNLADNQGVALRNQSSDVIDAKNNWWGSAEPAEIDKQIEDAADNADWGKVNYDPPLKAAPPARG